MGETPYSSVDELQKALGQESYLADRGLATSIHLALSLDKPLLLEGEAGVGKTEVAKVLSSLLGRRLIRLQCYEGIDAAEALYEWNYPRQLLSIRLADAGGTTLREEDLFGPDYLIRRPLLRALEHPGPRPAVLLIDELDRADEPFEAFLLEVLSDFQITIPETGTVKATTPPIVIVTSNRTREIHDAIKRRCLYHWVGFPDAAREYEILLRRVPGIEATLAREIVAFVQRLRTSDLFKRPGIAETVEWSRALLQLDAIVLDPEIVNDTLGVLLKYQDDIAKVSGSEAARLIAELREAIA